MLLVVAQPYEELQFFSIWKYVFNYLIFSDFPVLEILKTENYLKDYKQAILKAFYYSCLEN